MPWWPLKAGSRFGLRVKNRVVQIDPQDIRFVQYPEFFWQRGHSKKRISVVDGDWDRVIDGKLYWSGKYENISTNTGMLPIEKFVFFTSAKEHFLNGVNWGETEWVKWVKEKRIRRYRTDNDIDQRLAFLDKLFDACISGQFRTTGSDLPLINIGRDGRVSLDDGRHRICVAIIAGLRDIRGSVSTIHPESVSSKYGDLVLEAADTDRQ